MPGSVIDRIVIQRVVHQLVAERLIERLYSKALISDVERGAYVECMVELALSESRPPWSLTATWDAWDLEQENTGARIEVKQSAHLQTWSGDNASVAPRPSFDIRARSGYSEDGSKHQGDWRPTGWIRQADIYVMAWHGETDPLIADHRQPDQGQFHVVRESDLPEQKSISLNPLRRLTPPVMFGDLTDAVEAALDGLSLKANSI